MAPEVARRDRDSKKEGAQVKATLFVNHRVLRALLDKPLSIDGLALSTEIEEKELRDLCAMGLVIKDRDNLFSLSPFGKKLVKDIIG